MGHGNTGRDPSWPPQDVVLVQLDRDQFRKRPCNMAGADNGLIVLIGGNIASLSG